ncbi:2-amino-4-hydroxy-6-hydroxymethyldihydropteridine diphosphokinase [Pseudoteredinibacter isoporae]|uniref:2-amino-4-hydroxy-6-hydroxymethyldihydropteridine diphosphokinase n=1 Tax=Pseudoteredinibacter isoporae TaxID=570281 RepID=A0A7X0JTK4_9GAMM|nr:2-amino-4-hydroxy-6-hydroxymethyldihydropteridine diphosphokinase [Pseudoteredinibacter isoporae]MBB6521156.1 2-amino-4-hydroxy-6-hydroxymethyldihydropteridine diphosphokinase [Pseudoteredinibacter isoporae]NHO86716.1 2-amino-4-hydroxy-6-hydroxymethyldihydropteridine diphosphokinase [Pseudoteredinibacter isoporae]NIB24832.1 2-amino-4-hydroxy-6-hydroxymethyldihydropteridine diphosphokinase [Pseudoteredinibacter isoporae]
MARVFLSLGSNEDREFHITSCLDALNRHFRILALSSVYESEAVGFSGEPFYNMVVEIETELDLAALNDSLKKIEDENGRRRDVPRFSGRTLDVDILLYDDVVGNVAGIELPREEITQNAFVLLPLAEIAAEDIHPTCQQSYAAMWQAYDKGQKLWPIDFNWQGKAISKAQ